MGLKLKVDGGTFSKQPGRRFKVSKVIDPNKTRFCWEILIWEYCDLRAYTKILLLALKKHMKKHCADGAWPSYQVLCDRTGIKSRTTVKKHLVIAAAAGWILVEQRMNREEHQTNQYYPAIPPHLTDDVISSTLNKAGQEMIQGGSASDTPITNADTGSTGTEQRVPNGGTEDSKEESKEEKKEEVSTSSGSA
ncbi:helix-turn-helix domain-containing protein, partial [Gemmatimonadota bacterium]